MKNDNKDFEEKSREIVEETTSMVQVEDMTTDEIQLTEQLYYSAGLDPIVDAGIQDYDKKIEQELKPGEPEEFSRETPQVAPLQLKPEQETDPSQPEADQRSESPQHLGTQDIRSLAAEKKSKENIDQPGEKEKIERGKGPAPAVEQPGSQESQQNENAEGINRMH